MTKLTTKLLVILFFILILATVVCKSLVPLTFKDISETQVVSLLTSLFVIAAFLERALEVYISTSRGPGAMTLDNNIDKAQHELDKQPDSAEAKSRLLQSKHVREEYRLETQKASLWMGLIFGVLISAVGIRSLGALVINLDEIQAFQRQILNIVDVLLTGGLLAGGSNGLHKLAQVYTSYMGSVNDSINNQRRINSSVQSNNGQSNKPNQPGE